MPEIHEALLQVAKISDTDSNAQNEAKSSATNELGDYEFFVAIIIWFDILCMEIVVSTKH